MVEGSNHCVDDDESIGKDNADDEDEDQSAENEY